MTDLLRRGTFRLHSGEVSHFKIDCDALTNWDIKNFAEFISENIAFRSVQGVPSGGNRLARALSRYCDPTREVHLVVDDVLTTGASIEKVLDRAQGPVVGIVLFARRPPEDDRVHALFELHPMWSVL